MGRKCSVEGCLSDSGRQEDIGVTFHKVPPHSDVRPKWMTLCRIPEDKRLIKVIYICSRHFLRADFCSFKGKKYMLRQGVLPSVFPWDKSKLEAIKAEAKKEKHDVKDELDTSFIKNENAESSIDFKEEPLESEDNDNQISQDEIKVESKDKLDEFDKSKHTETTFTPINFAINTRIEALDFNNEWFPAKIVEVDYEENEVLIHFEKFSSKYDEWISMKSSRLRPIQADSSRKMAPLEKYVIGERCLAAWSDSRKFPATITKVMENDTYEVLFDDGFVKTLKAHRISKSQGKVIQSSPLFDPVQGSKQDRREKKRKLNVSALFRKRIRTDHSGDKQKKVQERLKDQELEPQDKQEPEVDADAAAPAENVDFSDWKPSWLNGKPVGTPSSLMTIDGPKTSVIVPDPRLPEGWNKHLLRRSKGTDAARKWDTVITSPDNKKFRSKTDVMKYLAANPHENVTETMFDFSLVSKRKKKNPNSTAPAKPPIKPPEPPVQPEPIPEEPPESEEEATKEENPNALKILFEDDAYKCPIEGCGKTFRRENLAQMHVKHYHPEYTKFLDSTPNVADLAYARTVGENLDRSPGPSKALPLKTAVRGTPKTSKQPNSPIPEMPDLKSATKPKTPALPQKSKDTEIIKLLSSKDPEPIQPLPSGLPMDMYPDIKLKDLLTKTSGVPNIEDLNMKNLCATRPPAGIKTLLPVHRQTNIENGPSSSAPMEETPKLPGRRKRLHPDNVDIVKGKDPPTNTLHRTTPSPLPPTVAPPIATPTATQETPLATPDPALPPNDVIIEGGEVIKIVRMKQEEIINCTCGFTEEDGLMIQCELCQCWQHAYCNNIERESQVPEKYVCYICQNPLRERLSRKFYHDQDWMKQGVLPVGSYHTKDNDILFKRFEKLKKCHDMSGGLQELREYLHNLSVKLKIAEAKNHPKLYLWSEPWPKKSLPEKADSEDRATEQKINTEDPVNENSMLMMLLKADKEVIPKIDLNTLMDSNGPTIPRPEAAIDSTDCRLNLLEHIIHQESLVEERLDDYERQIEALEEGMDMEVDQDYPRTRQTLQMLMRDLDTLKEFSRCTSI